MIRLTSRLVHPPTSGVPADSASMFKNESQMREDSLPGARPGSYTLSDGICMDVMQLTDDVDIKTASRALVTTFITDMEEALT